jgi:hypothetical protein
MQSSHEKQPIKFPVRSHPPIFVPQQEIPQPADNESLVVRVLRNRKGKVRWGYVWEIWRMQGKSEFSWRHRIEDDFGSVAPGIVGVNNELRLPAAINR